MQKISYFIQYFKSMLKIMAEHWNPLQSCLHNRKDMVKDPDPYLKKVLIYGTLYGTYKNMFIEGGGGEKYGVPEYRRRIRGPSSTSIPSWDRTRRFHPLPAAPPVRSGRLTGICRCW